MYSFSKFEPFCCSMSEKEMASHSSTLAWKIPWMEEPGGLQSVGLLRVGHDWATSLSLSCIGEENGNPLQCSCLENPRDGGAWWSAVYGVAQSQTRLKWLSSSSCSMSSSNYYLLTCTQVSQEAGKVVWYSHFFKNFLQFVVIHLGGGIFSALCLQNSG